jgi:photosynthetic reaction center H subunit
MYNRYFAGTMDITEVVLYLFFAFFLALVIYLQREGMREGYPLEHDVTGKQETAPGFFYRAAPKPYHMADGTTLYKPDMVRDTHETSSRRTAAWSGSPIEPTGNPLTAGIGPGAYAIRADVPDVDSHGSNRIAPLRVASNYYTDPKDAQMIGFTLIGTDGKSGGKITDIWVDRSEFLIRYLEVATINGDGSATGKTVLVPMTMCSVKKAAKNVRIEAVLGSQVSGAPQLANPIQVTLLEEEKIVGYFGAGYLYATAARAEPAL